MKKTGKIILSEDESFFGENLFEEKVFPKPLSKTFLEWICDKDCAEHLFCMVFFLLNRILIQF